MIILGIDPGTAITGWGLIQKRENKLSLIDYGCIRTEAHLAQSKRLVIIYQELGKLLRKSKPKAFATEKLFFFKNLKTAISVAQSQGVILLAAQKAKVPIFEYTPLQVKQAMSGYGRADKKQVQKMVKILLKLDKIPQPDDAADALALAICHAHTRRN
jgi:crossover junction endodeoxyribonuclease RuvC